MKGHWQHGFWLSTELCCISFIFFLRKTRHMQTVNRARMITVIMMIFTTRIMIIMIIIDDDRFDETTATTL